MHPHYAKAHALSAEIIGAAIEVHRMKGPGLVESIYEKCLMHMRLLNAPIGLLFNFNEPVLKQGMARLILDGADQP